MTMMMMTLREELELELAALGDEELANVVANTVNALRVFEEHDNACSVRLINPDTGNHMHADYAEVVILHDAAQAELSRRAIDALAELPDSEPVRNLEEFEPLCGPESDEEPDPVAVAARVHDQAMALLRMREALDSAGVQPIADQYGTLYDYHDAWNDAVALVAGGAA